MRDLEELQASKTKGHRACPPSYRASVCANDEVDSLEWIVKGTEVGFGFSPILGDAKIDHSSLSPKE